MSPKQKTAPRRAPAEASSGRPAAPPKSPSAKADIESALAAYFGRRYCCLTNRGTTALAAALHALDRPAGTAAVFPAAMCSIPVFAASFAGWRPVFADVSLRDGNFDPASLERILSRGRGRTGAVVPVHMFGQPDDLDALKTLCDRYGAALVEDLALSMGARYKGKRAGGFGTLACLSFVRKMLPLEMGGAVLTDDPRLHRRVVEFTDGLPALSAAGPVREQVQAAMKAFHSLTGYVAAGGWAKAGLLAPFEEEFRRLLLWKTTEDDWKDSVVLPELNALETAVSARRVRAEVFETVLTHPRLEPLAHGDSVFFAYPVRLKGLCAEAFLDFAARRGFAFKRVAYPDIHPVFGPKDAFPNAALLEKEVVGFPVDDNQPASSFWEYAQDFARVFEEYVKASDGFPPFDWRGKLELRMGQ